ncbi:MAP-homologous protein 1 [Diutina catenulata]
MSSPSNIDGTIKDIVDETYGVNAADIDFFIRDNALDPNQPLPQSPSSPQSHLNTAISNTNARNHSKTTSVAAETKENVVADRRPSQAHSAAHRKRSSVSSTSSNGSNSSSGGFFNKLKGKIHRSLSVSESNKHHNSVAAHVASPPQPLPPPPEEEPVVFKSSFSFGKPANDNPQLDQYVEMFRQHARRPEADDEVTLYPEDEIPSHPDHSPWPSVLVNNHPMNANGTPKAPEPGAPKFSLFRRRTITDTPEAPTSASPPGRSRSPGRSPPPHRPKPLKRVAFASSTFLNDPPQQIPSRTPREGNVEIMPEGGYKIRALTDDEKKQMELSLMGKGGGIVVGGSGALGLIPKEEREPEDEPEDEPTAEADEPAIDRHMQQVQIDKPIIKPRANYYSAPVEKMALDVMYTRCCHLREILPIPAILKQIPKGSMAPIAVLQLRNPSPSMVEIQTFADFVRIAPIGCLSLDGVSLSLEQFRIILSSITSKTQLEKLSLRNTPIDHDGWSLLCWFLSRNLKLNKLDITQCPSLQVNVLKKKKKAHKKDELVRMQCNMDNRSDMDWAMFIAALIARRGIDDLTMTGCCIRDLELFEKLITDAVCIRTTRLGLAFNQLDVHCMNILLDNWLLSSKARGLDLGYNDFSDVEMMQSFIERIRKPGYEDTIAQASLAFLSLNSSNVVYCDQFKVIVEKFLLRLPNLKYLDLSCNQRLFGTLPHQHNEAEVVQWWCDTLPLFPQLVRLHLEKENFSESSIITLSKSIPFCRVLGYFSIKGNAVNIACATALLQAVKNSSTMIYLECDLDNFPEMFKERLGLYTMRNMESLLEKTVGGSKTNASSLTQQLNAIIAKKTTEKLDVDDPEIQEFMHRALKVKSELRKSIEELLDMSLRNVLDMEGKETLIRFIFLDSAITTGLKLINPSISDSLQGSQAIDLVMRASAEGKDRIAAVPADADNPEPVNEPGAAESLAPAMSRTGSRSNLQSLDKEEGSFMKLATLHNYHMPTQRDTELEGVSGEQIRQKLSGADLNDLDALISYLSDLKAKGITLEDVYNHNVGHECGPEIEYTNEKIAAIEKRLRELARQAEQKEPADDDDSDGAPLHKTVTQQEAQEYGQVINEAYNDILKTFHHRDHPHAGSQPSSPDRA